MTPAMFTVGHSDRSIEEFVAVLRSADIGTVVDVRKLPGSRRHPHFDEHALGESLRGAGIGFERIPELTGRRPISKDVPFEVNAFWENRSFHNYADHALSDEFREGLARLRNLGRQLPTAIMCSEAVWWRCHRRIIADHLIALNEEVIHLMADRRHRPAVLTPGATVRDDGTVSYPAPDPAVPRE